MSNNLWSQALQESDFIYSDSFQHDQSKNNQVKEKKPENWHQGKKTHFVSVISTIVGVAAIAGFVPEMSAAEGISLVQNAGYASTFRAALSSGVGGLIGGLISKFK